MTALPLSVLQGLLRPEDYHNPEDLEKIAKLEAVVKSLRGKLEELVECNTNEVTGKKSRKSDKRTK